MYRHLNLDGLKSKSATIRFIGLHRLGLLIRDQFFSTYNISDAKFIVQFRQNFGSFLSFGFLFDFFCLFLHPSSCRVLQQLNARYYFSGTRSSGQPGPVSSNGRASAFLCRDSRSTQLEGKFFSQLRKLALNMAIKKV